jgi:hypothetical protein
MRNASDQPARLNITSEKDIDLAMRPRRSRDKVQLVVLSNSLDGEELQGILALHRNKAFHQIDAIGK